MRWYVDYSYLDVNLETLLNVHPVRPNISVIRAASVYNAFVSCLYRYWDANLLKRVLIVRIVYLASVESVVTHVRVRPMVGPVSMARAKLVYVSKAIIILVNSRLLSYGALRV
jgi:hypothetical protein